MEPEATFFDWAVNDVAAWFNVTRRTVHRWMIREDNPLPHSRPGGEGRARFNSDLVKKWGVSGE